MTVGLQPSLFNRLTETSDAQQQGLNRRNAYRQSIRRDLEALLNSRLNWNTWPEWYTELDCSLFGYGLPDFSAMPLSSRDGRDKLCGIVEQAIRRFEPRFIVVSVKTINDEQPLDRILRLRIRAICQTDDNQIEMTFDSEVEPVCLGIRIAE